MTKKELVKKIKQLEIELEDFKVEYFRWSTFGVGQCPITIKFPNILMSLKAVKLAKDLCLELAKCKNLN